jgi:outer membrane lipoprotein-sorting protein
MEVHDAADLAAHYNYSIRAVVMDGKPTIITLELRNNRINVGIKDGIITSILGTY